MTHRTTKELEAYWPELLASPQDNGELKMIVIRPDVDQRKVLSEGELDTTLGLKGDTWHLRGSSRTPDKGPHPDMQLNIMNARIIDFIAQSMDRWALAGDQLYIDLDLSDDNLPPGTRLRIGESIVEVTAQPHTGCKKFVQRFGLDAMKFVNSPEGRNHNLRGINAKVIQGGAIKTGQRCHKISH